MKCVKCNKTIARSLRSGWIHAGASDHVAMPRYAIQQLIKDLSYLKYGPVIYESFLQLTGNKYDRKQLIIIIYGALTHTNITAAQVNDMIAEGVKLGYSINDQLKSLKSRYGQL